MILQPTFKGTLLGFYFPNMKGKVHDEMRCFFSMNAMDEVKNGVFFGISYRLFVDSEGDGIKRISMVIQQRLLEVFRDFNAASDQFSDGVVYSFKTTVMETMVM